MHDISVDLPDPRDREDPEVQKMRRHLMDTFESAASVQKSNDGSSSVSSLN
jgi:NitT/TauT family transport system ATP-binding protein